MKAGDAAGVVAALEANRGAETVAAEEPGAVARFLADRKGKADQRAAFEALALRAARGDKDALEQLPAAVNEARELWRGRKFESKTWDVLYETVRQIITDDVMTEAEENHLRHLAAVLGTPLDRLRDQNFELFEEVVVAGINAGRFPSYSDPPVILTRGETAYASFNVGLIKEIAKREFRAGTSSVSIPLGGHVRYRVGGIRGRSEVVGTEMVVEDTGPLVVTSARSMFTGQKKTLEFRNDRLAGLQQFSDGLRLSVTNRQAASLFRFAPGESPSIAAALISAAARQQ